MSRVTDKKHGGECQPWNIPPLEAAEATDGMPGGFTRHPLCGDGLLSAEQLDRIQQQAHDEGFERGRREGQAVGRQELAAQAERLVQLMQTLAQPLAELDQAVEQDLLALAMAVARQLLRREITMDPSHIITLVQEAVQVLPSAARNIQLRLHPDDAALVREVTAAADGDKAWQLIEDATLSRGGCRVITQTSQVDATVEQRLDSMLAAISDGDGEGDTS